MKEGCIHRFLGMALTLVLLMYGTSFAGIPPLQIVSLTDSPFYTTSATVKLNLSHDGAAQMQFLTNNTTWSAWVAYAPTRTVTLPAGDGIKSVFVRFRDASGNTSPIDKSSIVLDTRAPVGSVAIEAGAAATETLDVTLSLAAADANGVTQMRFSIDGINWSEWESFAATRPYTLSGTAGIPGTKKVVAQFQDPAGKVSAAVYDTILYVVTPPPTFTTSAVTIKNIVDGGTEFTTATGVKLTISSPDHDPGYTQMSLSRNGTLWGGWIAIPVLPLSYSLPAGDGIKTVYAKFRAGTNGPESDIYGGTITLDTKPPVGTMVINGGAYSTGNPTVALTLYATDLNGVTSMQFSPNGTTWGDKVPYADTSEYTFSSINGVKPLYVRFIDGAGKVSANISDTIILDITPPVGTVKINSGAENTMNPATTLALTAPGATEMKLSIDDGATWGEWEPFATSRKISLPEGAGVKKVSVIFRDVTGNESDPVSDTITLNALQGIYKVVGRESSFYQSTWGDGLTHVTDNIWGSRATATFNGAGKCSIAVTSTGYDKLNNVIGESVKTNLESFTSTTCTYTVPDTDGAFAITLNGKVEPELSGRVAYDGNSIVMGGATVKEMVGGTSYDVDEMIGVRIAASGITAASMDGTYNLVSQEGSFWAGGGNVSGYIDGDNVTATFDGKGGCSVAMNGEGYHPDGKGSINVDLDTGTELCTYSITTTGAFTLTIGGIEKVTGWASADGNSVVMGGAKQKSSSTGTGTSYNTNLVGGVKAGTAMDISSVTGTYHLTGSDIAFWQSGGIISKNYWGSQADVTFDGSGTCTLTNSGTGYHVESDQNGNQNVVPQSDPLQTITDCSYTIDDPAGKFTVTLITPDGGESFSGWASADGNSVVMGGAKQKSDINGGTNYESELMFGVKVKP